MRPNINYTHFVKLIVKCFELNTDIIPSGLNSDELKFNSLRVITNINIYGKVLRSCV